MSLQHELPSGSYTPKPLDRIDAPKFEGSGETPPLLLTAAREKMVQLNEETRRKVAQNVLERLASLVPYRKRKIQLDEVIRVQPRRRQGGPDAFPVLYVRCPAKTEEPGFSLRNLWLRIIQLHFNNSRATVEP